MITKKPMHLIAFIKKKRGVIAVVKKEAETPSHRKKPDAKTKSKKLGSDLRVLTLSGTTESISKALM